VLRVDIDHFRGVQDTYGTGVGDDVVLAVAQTLREELRGEDLIGRWTGDSFLVVLPATAFEGALVAAERLRRAVALRTFPQVGSVTLSIGVATPQPGESPERVIGRADAGLDCARRTGRNRVAFRE